MIRRLFLISLFVSATIFGQNTVGTISVTNEAYDGFTLFSIHTKSYLIDNCGQVVHEWTSAFTPGNAVYLLPNGNLLRAGKRDGQSQINFGGTGGIIELFDWDGNLLWQYEYNTDQYRQHHDVYPMPNGNVLILAATVMSQSEAIQAGRDTSLLPDNEVYNERIFEVEPVGSNQVNVVWEWNAKDHLIQDFDNTKDNYGVVADHPEKLDFNFLNGGTGGANWLHVNSIQYDETLDQIVISSRNLSEVWIIDHSTTTAEAATGSGGIYGKGGDFLYRWGNPQSYDQGVEADRQLFGQHYPHYIENGLVDAGKMMIFNNGNGRMPLFSEVFIIDPPTSAPGVYSYTTNTAYGPAAPDYIYADMTNDPSDFYSGIVSGAQRLPNGNILICEGREGHFFEINASEEVVWDYINPVDNNSGITANQTQSASPSNIVFRALKYSKSYAAFSGKDVSPGQPIEGNPDLTPCNALSTDQHVLNTARVYPNPSDDVVTIETTQNIQKVEIYTLLGENVLTFKNSKQVDVSSLKHGIYLLKIFSDEVAVMKKIIVSPN
ncbi:aryl-sulfate sulfotransferase [Flavobacteriaceae bacterium S356]|uniref:Aryl-sulfate sulfotransferase n=1 Tax=Asprobacillus argus TaxID=3076534 RepID=A0ABU3LEL9_9FLAO|nr:aryl-sulfate sulfotransferase [Flavobacteriaceae bacterium S356]